MKRSFIFLVVVGACSFAAAQSANDDCAEAIDVSDGGSFPFDTTLATTDGEVPCGAMGNDVWFTFHALSDGTLTVDTCDSDYDTVVAIYGLYGPEVAVAAHLVSGMFLPAMMIVFSGPVSACVDTYVNVGESYLIQVGGFDAETGTGTLNVGISLPRFIRGDVNGNGQFQALIDSLHLLNFFFIPGSPGIPCEDAADADGNGTLNGLVDSLLILSVGFIPGTPPLPPPFPRCGPGLLLLGCETPALPPFCQ